MRTRGKLHWGVAAFAVLVALALIAGCAGKATSPSPTSTPTSTQAAGYPNADLVVETSWLGQNLGDAGIRVVDVRTAANYKAGHIQGAVSLPVEETFDPADPKMSDVGPVAQLEKVFGDRGISSDTRVIIYDGGREVLSGRLFWTLEYAGHTRVAYLNGGFTKWQKEGLPVSTEETKVAAAKFTVELDAWSLPQNAEALATKADVLYELGRPLNVFLDVRSPAEYRGDDLRSKRGGHIPGAVNVEWVNQFTSGDAPVLKSAAELDEIYEFLRPLEHHGADLGQTRDKTVYVY